MEGKTLRVFFYVRRMRFELTHRCRHYPLKVACLPIPPPAHIEGVPRTGLEPACLSTHAPETCASTNSATWAYFNFSSRRSLLALRLLRKVLVSWLYSNKKGRSLLYIKSGRRNSNPRPQPWQGCALPTELLPRYFFCFRSLSVFAFLAKVVTYYLLGQGCALPTELLPRYFFCFRSLSVFAFLAKVVTYYLLGQGCALPTELLPHCFFFAFAVCRFCFYLAKVGCFIFLGQGCALPTELLPHYSLSIFMISGCKDRVFF